MVCSRASPTFSKLQVFYVLIFSLIANTATMNWTCERFTLSDISLEFFPSNFIFRMEPFCYTVWMVKISTCGRNTLKNLTGIRKHISAIMIQISISIKHKRLLRRSTAYNALSERDQIAGRGEGSETRISTDKLDYYIIRKAAAIETMSWYQEKGLTYKEKCVSFFLGKIKMHTIDVPILGCPQIPLRALTIKKKNASNILKLYICQKPHIAS